MTLTMIREIAGAACILLGVVCCVIAVAGVYRFDYVLNRMHAAAVIDTLGTALIFLGAILIRGFGWASLKILVILFIQWVTSPVATHRIARVEILTNPDFDNRCEVSQTVE